MVRSGPAGFVWAEPVDATAPHPYSLALSASRRRENIQSNGVYIFCDPKIVKDGRREDETRIRTKGTLFPSGFKPPSMYFSTSLTPEQSVPDHDRTAPSQMTRAISRCRTARTLPSAVQRN